MAFLSKAQAELDRLRSSIGGSAIGQNINNRLDVASERAGQAADVANHVARGAIGIVHESGYRGTGNTFAAPRPGRGMGSAPVRMYRYDGVQGHHHVGEPNFSPRGFGGQSHLDFENLHSFGRTGSALNFSNRMFRR